jgi:hypothetical protein
MSGKGRRDRKYVGSVASLSAVQSDYVDRAVQPGDAQLLSYDPAVPIASPDPRTVVSYAFYAPYFQLSLFFIYLFTRKLSFPARCRMPNLAKFLKLY